MKKNWAIYAVAILGVCVIVGIIALPLIETRPLSMSELSHLAQPHRKQ